MSLRKKRPTRRRTAVARQPRVAVTRPNERWSMDFTAAARWQPASSFAC